VGSVADRDHRRDDGEVRSCGRVLVLRVPVAHTPFGEPVRGHQLHLMRAAPEGAGWTPAVAEFDPATADELVDHQRPGTGEMAQEYVDGPEYSVAVLDGATARERSRPPASATAATRVSPGSMTGARPPVECGTSDVRARTRHSP
jgi:hypothetical protein